MGDIELTRGEELAGFRVRVRIGRGARGSVWSAVDPLIGAKAVVKVLEVQGVEQEALPERVRRWLSEWADLRVSGLSSPRHVGHLSGPYVYIVRDFAPGRSLRELSDDGISVGQALELVARAARIVSAAHGAGLVHGNLSLDNVFVTPAGPGESGPRLTITDAGVAALANVGDAEGEGAGLPCDDLVALASLAHELIYRRPPQAGAPRFDPLGALLARGFETNHPAPFADVVELAEALEALRETYPGSDRPFGFGAAQAQEAQGDEEQSSEPERKPTRPRPAPRSSGRWASLARGVVWTALCLGALAVTYRILLDRWPGEVVAAPTPQATLELVSEPPGVQVSLDGRLLAGRTPMTLKVARGKPLALGLTQRGYRSWSQTIALAPDEGRRRLTVRLSPRAVRWGSLKLSASVQADFFLDGRCVGTQTREVTLAEVRADVLHRLEVRAPGHRVVRQEVRVPSGHVKVLDFRLAPQLAGVGGGPRLADPSSRSRTRLSR